MRTTVSSMGRMAVDTSSDMFSPAAHEPVVDAAWDPCAIKAAIRVIGRDADAALRGVALWPVHPLYAEPGDPDLFHGVYMSAAGVLLALALLAEAGLH